MNDLNQLDTIGGVAVFEVAGTPRAIVYKAGATVNGDGSPHCYHSDDDQALDYLANAGEPGNWWGVYAPDGEPVVQSIYYPAPGYYVSTTALFNPAYPEEHPNRYIDSERYPFCVIPGSFGQGWKLGDVGFCLNQKSGDNMYCATADIGPANHIGEVSMLLAKCLGLKSDPKTGGCESGIVYVVFPGSDPLYRSWEDKCQLAVDTFDKWGGLSRLKEIAKSL
jgi:hypothetical protein